MFTSCDLIRLRLLAGAAFLPLALASPARAETICSQAPDGTVECDDGGGVVATGSMTPGTVVNGPGLVATVNGTLTGSVAGTITTDVDGETAVSLHADSDIAVTVGDVVSDGDGVFAGSIDAGVSLATGDVASSDGRGVFVSGDTGLQLTCGNVQGAGEFGTAVFLIGGGDFVIHCGDVGTSGDFSPGVTATSANGTLLAEVGDVSTVGLGSRGLVLGGRAAAVSVGNIATDGIDADGLQVTSSIGNVTVTAGDVTTAEQGSQGVALVANQNLVAHLGDIRTAGPQSAAVTASAFGTAHVTAGDISTLREESVGIDVQGASASVACDEVTTSGANSDGVRVVATEDFVGSVDLTCGDVKATGTGSRGIVAFAPGNVSVSVGDVTSNALGVITGTSEGSFTGHIGNVTTSGTGGGIFASVSDGGGTLTCGNITTFGPDAPGLQAYASDGRLSVTCGSIRTEGDNSFGAFQGTDGLLTLSDVATLGDNSAGVILSSDFGVQAQLGDITTSGDASAGLTINADSSHVSACDISTSGDGSSGVVVDGGYYNLDLDLGQVRTAGANSHGLDIGFYGLSTFDTEMTVSVDGVAVSGSSADAIRFDSKGGDLAPTLLVNGDVTSEQGTAIRVTVDNAFETGLGVFDFDLGDGLTVRGRTGGIVVDADRTTLDIAGAVEAAEGPAIQAVGGPAALAIASTGSVRGFMAYGDGDDRVTNDGLLDVTGNSDFGAGLDRLTNNNRLVVRGGTGFLNLERFENNGTIDLQDGAPDDRLTISGDYVGGANAAVQLDVSRSLDAADVLSIGGAITGHTLLSIDWVDSNEPVNAGGVVIVEGAPSADAFTVDGLEDFGLFALTLRERNGDLYLMAAIDPAAGDLAPLGAVASDSWYQSFDALRASVAGRGSFLPKLGFWAQGYGGRDRSGRRQTANLFGVETPVSNRLESDRLGIQAGVDGSVGSVLVGATAGYEKSDADAGLDSDLDVRGFNLGAYAAIGASMGPYAAATAKHDRLKVEFTNSALAVPRLDATSTGADLELGWRGSLLPASLEVSAGLSVVRSTIDSFALEGTVFRPGSDTSVRGRIGGRLALASHLKPFAEAHLFHEFSDDNALQIVSGTLESRLPGVERGTWSRIEAGIGGAGGRGPLVSAWAEAGDREGFGLRAGLRF